MSQFFATAGFLLSFLACQAQTSNWAPVGAKWWYGYEEGGTVGDLYGYVRMDATKDTMVDGQSCRKLELRAYWFSSLPVASYDSAFIGTTYSYRSGDSVFYYAESSTDTGWSMLYYFGDSLGKTWEFIGTDFTGGPCANEQFTLDSLACDQFIPGQDSICGYFAISSNGSYVFMDPYTDLFGGMGFFLPLANCIEDGFWADPLRCYYEPSVGLINLTGLLCDTIVITRLAEDNIVPNKQINLYPNPTGNNSIIDLPPNLDLENSILRLFNASGQQVLEQSIPEGGKLRVNTVGLSSGMYLVEIWTRDQLISQKKLLIQGSP